MIIHGGYMDKDFLDDLIKNLNDLNLDTQYKGKINKENLKKNWNNIINFIKSSNDNDLLKSFIIVIKNILDSMYNYLNFVNYIKFIISEKKITKFKVLNYENYVTDTINVHNNTNDDFRFFKITINGAIEEYNGDMNDIIEDGNYDVLKISDENKTEFSDIYRYLIDNFDNYKSLYINYYSYIKFIKPADGLNIDYLFESLFYINDNDILFINKSYNNIINQIIYTGKIKEFMVFINELNLISREGINISMKNAESDINFFIYNKKYKDLYDKFMKSVMKGLDLDKINLIEYVKNNKIIDNYDKNMKEILLNGIKHIFNWTNNFIDDYLITVYNSSIVNIYIASFQSINMDINNINSDMKTEILNFFKSFVKIIDLTTKNKQIIKSMIKVKLLFILLPIYMFPFEKDEINKLLFYYISKLLIEGSNYSINKKFVFDKIFGKNYLINVNDPLYSNIFNKLSQCYVSYIQKINNNNVNIIQSSCGETVLLNILEKIFYDNNILNEKKMYELIKSNTPFHSNLKDFFIKHKTFSLLNTPLTCVEFTRLISNINGIEYGNNIEYYKYDLVPTMENITKLLIYILDGKIIETTREEYIKYYKKLFDKVIPKQYNENILNLELNNMHCSFSNNHAYVGTETKGSNDINDSSHLYLTLYIKKYYEQVYELIINPPKKHYEIFDIIQLYYYMNLNFFDLKKLTIFLSHYYSDDDIFEYLVALYKNRYNWLINETKILQNQIITYDKNIECGIHTSMAYLEKSIYNFSINNIFLFITALFNEYNETINFFSLYKYMEYNNNNMTNDIYEFIVNKIKNYNPKEVTNYLSGFLIIHIIKNYVDIDKKFIDHSLTIVDNNQLLTSYISIIENFGFYIKIPDNFKQTIKLNYSEKIPDESLKKELNKCFNSTITIIKNDINIIIFQTSKPIINTSCSINILGTDLQINRRFIFSGGSNFYHYKYMKYKLKYLNAINKNSII